MSNRTLVISNQAIDSNFLTVDTNATAQNVIALMSEARTSCALVVHQKTFVGILTVGIADAIPNSNTNPETLIQSADIALYRAKSQGRDCIQY